MNKNQTLSGDALLALLPVAEFVADVCYRDSRDLAMKVTYTQARVLCRSGMIDGYVRNGRLRYLILTAPKHKAVSLLATDAPRNGEITRNRVPAGSKRWAVRLDRADGGIIGSSRTLHIGVSHAVPNES